jgi:hypothetical protein
MRGDAWNVPLTSWHIMDGDESIKANFIVDKETDPVLRS